MFNRERSIKVWRKTLRKYQSMEDGYVDELENHLCDIIDEMMLQGYSEEEAFKAAVQRIGNSEIISEQYYSEDTKKKGKRPPWKDHPLIPALMTNYIKIALRNIKRSKGFSFINIVGLSLGIAAFLLISLYINHELSYDKYHSKTDDIYRVYTQFIDHHHGDSDKMAICRYGVGPAIKEAMPEVEEMFRFFKSSEVTFQYGNKSHFEETVFAADPTVFDVLDLNVKRKAKNQLLNTASSLVITESAAEKLFGDKEALGQVLLFNGEDELVVEAIIADIPAVSHFHFDFLYSEQAFEKIWQRDMHSWENGSCYTYLLLNEYADPKKIESKLDEFVDDYFSVDRGHQNKYHLLLQNIADIHLYSNFDAELEENNDINNIYLFFSIAMLILLIASLNYINLTTAKSIKRGKEVAIRKTIGATRAFVARQFLSESVIIALLAFGVSIVILWLVLPSFNSFVERSFGLQDLFEGGFLVFAFIFTIAVGLLSGLYPSLIISANKPTTIFTGKSVSGKNASLIRNILVVAQFSISIALIICTLVIDGQMKYILNTDLGYEKEQIVVIETPSTAFRENLDIIKNELRSNPNLAVVSSSSYLPNRIMDQAFFDWPGRPEESYISTYVGFADYDWIDMFEIDIVKGRNFSREFPSDAQGAFLINETAVKALQWDNPLGKELTHWSGITGQVVGVVKDFNFLSLHQEIEPLYIFFEPKVRNYFLTAKISGGTIPGTIEYLSEKWNRFMPGKSFEYNFFDEEFNKQYKDELKMQSLFKVFSMIAIFISALGLLGLASYTTERRTKEIGVRKVLGASVLSVNAMLVKEFTKWVVLSNAIAWPVAYYFMHRWLNDFVYRIDLALWIFVLSAAVALLVAIISVGYQSLKAALSNPVKSLRYE